MRSISRSNGSHACSWSTHAMSVSDSASRRCRAMTETLMTGGLDAGGRCGRVAHGERVVVGIDDGWREFW